MVNYFSFAKFTKSGHMNLILGPPLCPCANEGSWSVCVLGVMVLSPLPVTMPSASSLSPVLHHTWFFQALNLSWILWGWLVPGTCILLLLLRLLLPLPFFQIKKKIHLCFFSYFFSYLFGFIHFSFLNGVWGGRRTYMFSMVCVCKEDGSTLAVPWLGIASNWSHSRL